MAQNYAKLLVDRGEEAEGKNSTGFASHWADYTH